MNTTAERLHEYGMAGAYSSAQTAAVTDDYQFNLIASRAANDYTIHTEGAGTAKNRPNLSESTVVTSPVSFLKPAVRIAEWDGCVTAMGDFSFEAALKGVSGEGVAGELHDAEIALDDVSRADKKLLRPGALFRLCIYFQLDEDDRPKRYAKVVFRRLPAYRRVELELADARSEDRHRRLRVE